MSKKPIPYGLKQNQWCVVDADNQTHPFKNIQPSVAGVWMCTSMREPLSEFKSAVPIQLEIVKTAEPNSYYGWWDAEQNNIAFVLPFPYLVEICFGNELEYSENAGRGRLVVLQVSREDV